MPAITLEQLLTQLTIDQARQTMIRMMQSLGFKSAASWEDGSFARTFGIEMPAQLLTDLSVNVPKITRGGYNDLAEEGWLTLYSRSAYQNDRKEAQRARGSAVLTSSPSSPPYPIGVDYLVARDPATSRRFRNKTSGTLPTNGTLTLEFEAEVAGPEGNISTGQLTELVTPLAGVTINNPGVDGVWLLRLGTKDESDPSLRTRNATKWATRAYPAPAAAWINWALQADAAVTRAEVDGQNPDGPGTLRIYIAGSSGTLPGSVAMNVMSYINGGVDGIVRAPLGSRPACLPADAVLLTVSGTIFIAAAYSSTAPSQTNEALLNFLNALPIGGTRLTDENGALLFSALYGAAMKVPGVVNAAFTNPTADLPLTMSQVIVPTLALSYVVV